MFRLEHYSEPPFTFRLDPPNSEVALPSRDDTNRVTVLIGANGSGKSKLLRSVAETYRNTKPASISDEKPHPRVLVLTNLVNDVFVLPRNPAPHYFYLGLRRASNNVSTRALTKTTIESILSCMDVSPSGASIQPALNTLSIDQLILRLSLKDESQPPTLRAPLPNSERREDSMNPVGIPSTRDWEELSRYFFHPTESTEETEVSLPWGTSRAGSLPNLSSRLSVPIGSALNHWVRLGLISVSIDAHINEALVNIADLSSGQLLTLSTFARIAAHIVPGSLVIVDEPEVGLHPNWQSGWVPLLRECIPSNFGCHFLVATHSPFLVADADDVLVPGDKWGHFDQFQDPHQGRSVENILYRVFGATISGNLMVEEDLRIVLDYVSNGTARDNLSLPFTHEALRRLQQIRGQDTVELNLLIEQAEEKLAQ